MILAASTMQVMRRSKGGGGGGGGSHCLNCGQLTSCFNSNVSAVISSSDANEKPVKAMDELGIYKH
jgi:hypothetical protein